VGVDLEIAARVEEKLHERLFTEAERTFLSGSDPQLAGLLFSAKEAGYKATYPLAQRFIGFQEAEVSVDLGSATFRFTYVGEDAGSRVMEEGEGCFVLSGRYVFTLVVIP
jgi:4'-phosphopantetheinyl transferase EntD